MSRRTAAGLCRLGVLAACAAMAGAAAADTVSDFFSGKTVSLIVGFPPGGGYDTYIRLLARHYGAYLGGHPSMVPANMPGAGSLVAASYLYAKAPADGTVLAMFAASAAMEPLLGNKSAQFDPAKFGWIGSMSQQVTYCGVWQSPGAAKTFDDMLTQETIFGGGSAAAITFQHPTILKNVLGAKIRVIPGYPGSREINLAMHRGEVNGARSTPPRSSPSSPTTWRAAASSSCCRWEPGNPRTSAPFRACSNTPRPTPSGPCSKCCSASFCSAARWPRRRQLRPIGWWRCARPSTPP
jgi:tripartite-type tricarboxylate transporter receptor subunit TctC